MELRKLTDIKIGKRHRKDMGDLRALADSIAEIGLLHPPVILPTGELIVGERRIRAAELLKWTDIPVHVAATVKTAAHLIRAESDENTCRKDFTPSEAYAVGVAVEKAYAPEAKAKQKKASGGDRRSRKAKDQGGKTFPTLKQRDETARTSAVAAAAVGMTRPTFEKLKEVVESGDEMLIAEMDRTGKVSGAHKKLKTRRAAEEIAAEPPPLPTGPFRVIVADPPWKYDNREEDTSHRAANPYPSMTIEQIAEMPIRSIAHDNSILWLWVTNSHLPEVWRIVDAWGFTYKTMLTWAKDRMGTGDWLRGQTEHCLMCVRGKPTIVLTNQTTLLRGPLRAHSKKPDEFYSMVEALCPGSKVELFCRRPRDGWEVFGNEV